MLEKETRRRLAIVLSVLALSCALLVAQSIGQLAINTHDYAVCARSVT